jgi:HAD superfamily hydrolase (TIGR01509 family)
VSGPVTVTAAEIVRRTRVVLLDFDGPVCSIFAHRVPWLIAKELAELLASRGVEVPGEIVGGGDPLEVLRFSGLFGGTPMLATERQLTDAELEATETATATPGAAEFLAACRATGRPVAVVSNNSAQAVRTYLDRVDLVDLVEHIEGRDPTNPAKMKPDPTPVRRALRAIGGEAQSALLIGDSDSDQRAARAARVHAIGYANKPGKSEALTAAGADAIVRTMTELAGTVARTPIA